MEELHVGSCSGNIIMKHTRKEFDGLYYEDTTGVLSWEDEYTPKSKFTVMKHGHILIHYNRKTFLAHRVIWFLYYGSWPTYQIDHINGLPDDNRIENLRDVPAKINAKNQKMRFDNTSGFVGVYFHKPTGKWQARVFSDGKAKSLGLFLTKEEAYEVRKRFAKDLGFHENHGRHRKK